MNFNWFGANRNSIDLNGKNHLNTNQITSSSFNILKKHSYANALRCFSMIKYSKTKFEENIVNRENNRIVCIVNRFIR